MLIFAFWPGVLLSGEHGWSFFRRAHRGGFIHQVSTGRPKRQQSSGRNIEKQCDRLARPIAAIARTPQIAMSTTGIPTLTRRPRRFRCSSQVDPSTAASRNRAATRHIRKLREMILRRSESHMAEPAISTMLPFCRSNHRIRIPRRIIARQMYSSGTHLFQQLGRLTRE